MAFAAVALGVTMDCLSARAHWIRIGGSPALSMHLCDNTKCHNAWKTAPKQQHQMSQCLENCGQHTKKEAHLHPSMVVVGSPIPSLSSDCLLYETAATPYLVSMSNGHMLGARTDSTLS